MQYATGYHLGPVAPPTTDGASLFLDGVVREDGLSGVDAAGRQLKRLVPVSLHQLLHGVENLQKTEKLEYLYIYWCKLNPLVSGQFRAKHAGMILKPIPL